MKFYLSGPMTGIPEFNFPAFDAAADWLRRSGHEVFSPADNDRRRLTEVGIVGLKQVAGFLEGDVAQYNGSTGVPTASLLRDDFNYIVNEADAIILLPGWERSTGARWERTVAEALNLPVYLLGEFTHGLTMEEAVNQKQLTEFLSGFPVVPEPDITRPATAEDRVLAGTLSTLWPMSSRHPEDALHLAIYVNDRYETPTSTKALLAGLLKNIGHVPHVAELVHKIEASLG